MMFLNENNEKFMNDFWDREIVPTLMDFIRIPCLSPNFDPEWESTGHIDKALQLVIQWLKPHLRENDNILVKQIKGLTPILIVDIEGNLDKTVMLYGHLDKQPEMIGWREDLGPWKPVIEGDKLYGRGSVDDGYAVFAAMAIVKSIRSQGANLPQIKIVIEFSEESGSMHFPPYLEAYPEVFGNPDTIICLDSGAGNYDQLWLTTSLKGMMIADLNVHVLKEGCHSGTASGVIPSSFRILRQLLSRIENETSGEIHPEALQVSVPDHRKDDLKAVVDIIGNQLMDSFPVVSGLACVHENVADAIIDNTWKTTLSILGQYSIPDGKEAGNVMRPSSGLKLSFRFPPTLDPDIAAEALTQILTENPPYQCQIELDIKTAKGGWDAALYPPEFKNAIDTASQNYFDKPAIYQGLGGSIGFVTMLEEIYPKASFIITGAFGPHANIHGPNEFINIPYAKKVTACVAEIVANI